MSPCPLPASSTKHLERLDHPVPRDDKIDLPLRQISSEGGASTGTTGTTLWLGAQVLAAYLADTLPVDKRPRRASAAEHSPEVARRKRCLDLGSGIGLLPLCLASWGWDVTATDIEPVVSTVLRQNVEQGMEVIKSAAGRMGRGPEVGSVQVQQLDWTDYDHGTMKDAVPKDACEATNGGLGPSQGEYIDLLLTSDTLYTPHLVRPLWSTLAQLSAISRSRHPKGKAPEVYLALENRDPGMIESALAIGREMGFAGMKRIPEGKLGRALEKAGWGWKRADWEGVEVWKMRLSD